MEYVPPIGGAANDPYVDANPGTATEGSAVSADAIENPQREIVSVITDAGLIPAAANLSQLSQAIRTLFQKATAISAAASGTVDAITANFVPAITVLTDHLRVFVRAGGANTVAAPTFTPNSGSIVAKTIVKGHNQALVAGDISGAGFRAELQYDLTLDKWVLLNPATGVSGLPNAHGQCRLALSGGNIKLSPLNGNKLIINGATQVIPAAGVSLAPAGLTAGQLYYIYAYMSAGTMTLEASATGHSTDATTGVEIKTGDATRSLVGMARPVAGPAWQDSTSQRFVISWFNRRRITSAGLVTANRTTTSPTYVEMGLSSERAEFLCWGDDDTELGLSTVTTTASGAVSIDIMPGTDGANNMIYSGSRALTVNANEYIPHTKIGGVRLSEGYHYQAIFGQISGGATLTILGGGYSNNLAIVQG